MSAFAPVACPRCERPKVGELYSGVARFKCPGCKALVMAGRDKGGEVRILASAKQMPVRV